MAITIQKKFSVDLGTVVENSITAVKAVRRSEQTRKEAEFQRAIANGLSYEEQLKLRQKQLDEENTSSIKDAEYVATLEKSISDTKKLGRFNKYRTKYAQTFGELSAGKINEQTYLDTLKNQLVGISDEELRLEIQNDIAAAEKQLKVYNDTILANKVKLAQNDGTAKVLTSILADVNAARTSAVINNNQDEVSALDETVAALNSQLAGVRIQDAFNDFQVKSATKGTNSLEKLDFMNSQIKSADINTPVTITDASGNKKTYTSVQQFWTLTRDEYLSTNFFKELETDVSNNIAKNAKLGVSQVVLDNVARTYDDLRTRPEMIPFMSQLDAQQANVMSPIVTEYANKVVEIASQNFDFANGEAQLSNITKRYGVGVESQQITLRNRNIAMGEEATAVLGAGEAAKRAISTDLPLPKISEEKSKPVVPATPVAQKTEEPIAAKPIETGSIIDYLASTGKPTDFNSRAQVAAEKGITNYTGTAEQNTKLLSMLRGEQAPTETKPITATPTAPETPVVTGSPATTKTPETPTTPSTYQGASIVDYLKSQNQDSSFESRKKIAAEKGIADYAGTTKQNEELLKLLRG